MHETRWRIRGAVRWFTLGSGPLRRGTDRFQAWCRVLLLVIVLAAAPLAWGMATLTGHHLSAVATEQAHARHRPDAVLLQDAVSSNASDPTSGTDSAPVATAPARWITAAGTPRVGTVSVNPGARAGEKVPVWTAADGGLTTAPLDRQSVIAESVTAGISTAAGVGLVGWGLYGLVCWRLARHRDRQWTAGWATVAPVWRAQLR